MVDNITLNAEHPITIITDTGETPTVVGNEVINYVRTSELYYGA
jgi:hypothetical protein